MTSKSTDYLLRVQADTTGLTAKLKQVEKEVNNLGESADKTGTKFVDVRTAATSAGQAVGNFGNQLKQARQSAVSAHAPFAALARTLFSIGVVKVAVDMADAYGQLASRLKMATKNEEEFISIQQQLVAVANETYRPFEEAVEGFLTGSQALKDLGYNAQQAMDIISSMTFAFTTHATKGERAAAAQAAFAKAMATGRLDAHAWQTMISAIPDIVDKIAGVSGKSAEEVRKLGMQGKVSANLLAESFRRSLEDYRKKAKDMPVTVRDAWQAFRNDLMQIFGSGNEKTGLTQIIVGFIETAREGLKGLSDFADKMMPTFQEWGKGLQSTAKMVGDAFSNLADWFVSSIGTMMDSAEKGSNSIIGSLGKIIIKINEVTRRLATFVGEKVAMGDAYSQAIQRTVNKESETQQRIQNNIPQGDRHNLAKAQEDIYRFNDAVKAVVNEGRNYANAIDYVLLNTGKWSEAVKEHAEGIKGFAQDVDKYNKDTGKSVELFSGKVSRVLNETIGQLHAGQNHIWTDINTEAVAAADSLYRTEAAAIKSATSRTVDEITNDAKNKLQALRDSLKKAREDFSKKLGSGGAGNGKGGSWFAGDEKGKGGKNDEAYVQGLERQARAIGKTAAEVRRLELAEKSLTAAQKQRAEAALKLIDAEEAMQKALANTKAAEDLRVRLLKAQGQETEAAMQEIKQQLERQREELVKAGNDAGVALIDQLIPIETAKTKINALMAEIEKATGKRQSGEQSLQAQVTAGLISQTEAQKRIIELRKQEKDILAQIKPVLEQMAQQEGAVGDAARQALDKVNKAIAEANQTTSLLAATLKNGVESGISKALEGLANGTMNLREAINALINEVATSLMKMAANNLAKMAGDAISPLFGSLKSLFGGAAESTALSTGSIALQGAATTLATSATTVTASAAELTAAGATLPAGAAAISAAAAQLQAASFSLQGSGAANAAIGATSILGGFASGGYTGSGGVHAPAGVVHRGEFVIPQRVMKQRGALEFFSQFLNPKKFHFGYATGGLVTMPSVSVPSISLPDRPVGASLSADNSVGVYVYNDPDRLTQAVINNTRFKQAVVVEASENGKTIRQSWGQ